MDLTKSDLNNEYVEEDLSNKSHLLLESNPVHRQIPVLIHDGRAISESTVILEYIDEAWPESPLLPRDPFERAVARFWTKFLEDKSPIFYAFFGSIGEEQERAAKEGREVLRVMEEYGLRGKNYFGGDNIGMVDLVFGWISWWLDCMEEILIVKLLDPKSFPLLQAWTKHFKNVPQIKESLPQKDQLLAYFRGIRENKVAAHTK